MKRFWALLLVLACSIAAATAAQELQVLSSGYGGGIGGCKQSDSCSTPHCSKSITCASGECSYCSCGSNGCSCDCRGKSSISLDLNERITMSYSQLNFDGFVEWIASRFEGWSITRVGQPDRHVRLTGAYSPNDREPRTAHEILIDLANGYGLCVAASGETRTIALIECR